MRRTLYKNKNRIKTLRLPWWDYSEDGDYFITIRTYHKGNIFGKILNENIVINIRGKIVQKYILEIPDHFANVILRSWVIMPDHVHFILRIRNKRKLVEAQHCCVSHSDDINIGKECNNGQAQHCWALGKDNMNKGTESNHLDTQRCCVSTNEQEIDIQNEKVSKTFYKLKPGSIPVIVRSFKSICSRTIHSIENNKQFKWQRSFYDKVIFNDQVLQNIELYIKSNQKNKQKNKTPIRRLADRG
jgi:REP element-mobilizing transposase RayT